MTLPSERYSCHQVVGVQCCDMAINVSSAPAPSAIIVSKISGASGALTTWDYLQEVHRLGTSSTCR